MEHVEASAVPCIVSTLHSVSLNGISQMFPLSGCFFHRESYNSNVVDFR